MHVTYEIRKTFMRVFDETKQQLLETKQSSTEGLNSFIKSLRDFIDELEAEQGTIINACAQFCCYLKENAITTFNDAIESHSERVLYLEKSKPSPSKDVLMKLESMKKNYQQQKHDILRAMEQSDSSSIEFISEPDMVYELQEKLFALKHNGGSLREIFEANRRARDERYSTMAIEPIKLVPHRLQRLCKNLKKSFVKKYADKEE